jgi:hypothetical protein
VPEAELGAAIAELDAKGLVVIEGDKILCLLMPGKTSPRPTPYFLRATGATPTLPPELVRAGREDLLAGMPAD